MVENSGGGCTVELGLQVWPQSTEVSFDPMLQEHVVCFNLMAQMPLTQMLQGLSRFQQDGLPWGDGGGRYGGSLKSRARPPAANSMPQSQYGGPPNHGSGGPPSFNAPPNAGRGGKQQGRHVPAPYDYAATASFSSTAGPTASSTPGIWGQGQGQGPDHGAGGDGRGQAPTKGGHSSVAIPAPAPVKWNRVLFDAVKTNNVSEAKRAIDNGADLEAKEGGSTCLHRAVISGGHRSMVSLLLDAQAGVNTVDSHHQAPLHLAVQRYKNVSPSILRMLLCYNADINQTDAQGKTALDSAKDIITQAGTQMLSGPARAKVRQLLHEVTECPTIVMHVDEDSIRKAVFTDLEGSRVAFFTKRFIGVLDVGQRQVVLRKRLQQAMGFEVQSIAASAAHGAVAAVVEFQPEETPQSKSHMVFVWSSYRLQEAEPLKLQVGPSVGPSQFQSPDIAMSQDPGNLTLVLRTLDGQIFCWQLDDTCSRVLTEFKVCEGGTAMAVSANGMWVVAAPATLPGGGALPVSRVELWSLEHMTNGRPERVLVMRCGQVTIRCLAVAKFDKRNPQCSNISGIGYVAWTTSQPVIAPDRAVEEQHGAVASIQVWVLHEDGQHQLAYEIRKDTRCWGLAFCQKRPAMLMSAFEDGQVAIYELTTSLRWTSCDDLSTSSVSLSSCGKFGVTSCSNFLRVFRTLTDSGNEEYTGEPELCNHLG